MSILPSVLSIGQGSLSDGQLEVIKQLKQWDGVEDVGSKGALFFHAFLKEFITNVYQDELSLLGSGYWPMFH